MRVIAGLSLALIAAQPALAQSNKGERPEAFKKLIDCRLISDPASRLACFDRETAAVDAAEKRSDLVVFDRAQVRKTQRSLFGLALPNLNIFGDDSDEAQKEIATTIKRAWLRADRKWAFELPDGARWAQTDSRVLTYPPKPGQPVRIRRGAFGSYVANIDRQTAVRVQRVR